MRISKLTRTTPLALAWRPIAFVMAGGAIGALARWAVVSAVDPLDASAAMLAINVAGSILFGVLLGRRRVRSVNPTLDLLVGTGFAGGLTSFSSFAVDLAVHIDAGDLSQTGIRFIATPGLAVLGAGLGYRLGRVAFGGPRRSSAGRPR